MNNIVHIDVFIRQQKLLVKRIVVNARRRSWDQSSVIGDLHEF